MTEIKPGDILLVHGASIIDAVIRWGTSRTYNHAAIVATDGVSVIEAQTPVARKIPASFYAGRADVWRLMPFAPNVALTAAARAERFVGKPYGFREALASGLWDVAHVPVMWRLRHLDCSGLCVQAYSDAGLLLTRHPFPAPADLGWSALIGKVGAL